MQPDVAEPPKSHTVSRDALSKYLASYLDAAKFSDAAPNGLQVEGAPLIRKLVMGVTANQPLIDAAIAASADAILVHHGLFWKGDDPRLVGFHRQRAATLLNANVNLFAYHLPLDVHAELGNNAQLAKRIGLRTLRSTGPQQLVMVGELLGGVAVKSPILAALCARHFGNRASLFSTCSNPVKSIAWCTGAGGSLLRDAIEAGAEAFITGEISEHHIHVARESNIALIAIGHHASERGGVMALGQHLARKFGIATEFIEVPSPM